MSDRAIELILAAELVPAEFAAGLTTETVLAAFAIILQSMNQLFRYMHSPGL